MSTETARSAATIDKEQPQPAFPLGQTFPARDLLARKPRAVLRSLLVSLTLGLLYLGWIRISDWDPALPRLPYLAVLVVSMIMGGNACVNSVTFDATRVRGALDSGFLLRSRRALTRPMGHVASATRTDSVVHLAHLGAGMLADDRRQASADHRWELPE